MSTDFEFLKEYNKFAYKWALNMRRTLYKEPLAALTYGGRFLESIRTALYQIHYKEMAKYNRNLSKSSEDIKINSQSFKRDDFSKHISDLSHAGQIERIMSFKIINAYNIRHRLHENEDVDDIQSDKEAALELYKRIYEIAIWFSKHKDPTFNDDGLVFSYPSEEEINDEIPDVDIVRYFNDCVICGGENISPNRNICPECYRKIRLASDLDDLMNLLNNENRFTLDFLKSYSYDRYEIDYTLHFLKQYELISRESKNEYFINMNKAYNFIEEMMSYEEVEKILLAFYNELIGYEDIDISEGSFYKLGENGESYSQFYLLVITKKIKHYLNLKSKNHPNALGESGVNINEISYWYRRKVRKIIQSNYKRDLDISFNQMSRLLMDKYIEYRKDQKSKEWICEKLKINDDVLDFWLDESLRKNNKYHYIREFIFKNREIEMRLFVEGLSLGLNKKDALEYADTSLEFVDKYFNLSDETALIRRWRIGKQTNNEEYFNKYKIIYYHAKTKEFLDALKSSDIESALLKSDLDEDDFNKWYNAGKREFYRYNCNWDDDLYKFYIKTTKVLMDNWLNERKQGHKKLESCKNIGLYSDTLDEWFKFETLKIEDLFTNPKYKTFRNFYIKNDQTNMDLIIKAIEEGQNKKRVSKTTDIEMNEMDALYSFGKYLDLMNDEKNQNEIIEDLNLEVSFQDLMEEMYSWIKSLKDDEKESYINYFKKYDELYDSKRIEEFLNLCNNSMDIAKVIKRSELSEDRITFMYEHGKQGKKKYKEFYERFLEIKLETYAMKINQKEDKTRALKSTTLTEEEIEENASRIEVLKLIFNMVYLINRQSRKKLDKIVKKAPFSMNDVFEWFKKGKDLMEESPDEYLELNEFSDTGSINFFNVFNEIKAEEGDFNPYYKKFYNVYNELHVKIKAKILSKNYTENKRFLRHILKDLKVTEKEYKFWMELGLIKNEREMKLDNDEDDESLEKRKYKIRRI